MSGLPNCVLASQFTLNGFRHVSPYSSVDSSTARALFAVDSALRVSFGTGESRILLTITVASENPPIRVSGEFHVLLYIYNCYVMHFLFKRNVTNYYFVLAFIDVVKLISQIKLLCTSLFAK